MGALAGLLKAQGHRVTGSDRAFHPPMGPALRSWGVETMPGWDPANLEPAPDLVVVGNVCRRDNPEARAAIDGGLRYTSLPAALQELFLPGRTSYVVAGTHGKTTTSSLLAVLLRETGKDPGMFVGGIPRNFDVSFRLGAGEPFVLEGDEYDTAFFEKKPKFWRYEPWGVALTSIEHDHIDIYPDEASYLAAFVGLVERIPEDGLLVAWAGDPRVRRLAGRARCRVRFYGLIDDDCGEVSPIWSAAIAQPGPEATPFDVYGGGTFLGRATLPMSGAHNVRNALAAIALAAEGAGSELSALMDALGRFAGVRRRQELLAVADEVHVYEDFAHHPTAVRETLAGLRARHPRGRLIVAFEPRSATASRNLHQEAYPEALAIADVSVLAPVGRPEIADTERLDVVRIAAELRDRGRNAVACPTLEDVRTAVVESAEPGDVIVLMSNGHFGAIYDEVIVALTERRLTGG